ncbi:MAG TPA: hypothetical protein VFY10_09665 [Dehalococcoidia bacterium]|nr:hypothetical protein [Dehalococcoidia bacterium]
MRVFHEVAEAVGADVDAVLTTAELALAERAQEVAILVEHDNGMLAAIEHVDVVIRVDGDARSLGELVLGRYFRPLVVGVVGEVSGAQVRRRSRHSVLSLAPHVCAHRLAKTPIA